MCLLPLWFPTMTRYVTATAAGSAFLTQEQQEWAELSRMVFK